MKKTIQKNRSCIGNAGKCTEISNAILNSNDLSLEEIGLLVRTLSLIAEDNSAENAEMEKLFAPTGKCFVGSFFIIKQTEKKEHYLVANSGYMTKRELLYVKRLIDQTIALGGFCEEANK